MVCSPAAAPPNSHLGVLSDTMRGMRWITFLILLFFMSALQMSHFGGFPDGRTDTWPRIEYLPLLAVFYALYAAESSAGLAALLCGVMYDIIDDKFIGTHMAPLVMVTWLLVRIRLSIFREHAISQVIMTLLTVAAFGALSAAWRDLVGAPLYRHAMLPDLGRMAGNAMYTALVAPMVCWLFFRFKGMLGFSALGSRR